LRTIVSRRGKELAWQLRTDLSLNFFANPKPPNF
jgi:hypothetical protein